MNSRILELAEQAKNSVPKDTLGVTEWIAVYNQKFAELIVKECADIFNKDEIELTYVESSIHNMIKEHFGVNT